MFDIGFWELSIIMVVALLVIGPERMPGLARKAGLYFGKARRFVSSVKDDINREFAADELKRILEEQKSSVGMHEILEETRDALDEAKKSYLVKNDDKADKAADTQDTPTPEKITKSESHDRESRQDK